MHRASSQQQQYIQANKPQPAIGHHPPGQHPMQQRGAAAPPPSHGQQQRYGTQQQPQPAYAYAPAHQPPYAGYAYPPPPPPPNGQQPQPYGAYGGYPPAGYPPAGYAGPYGGYPQAAYLPPMPDPSVPDVDYSKLPVTDAVQGLVEVAKQHKSNLAMLRNTVDELTDQLHQVMDKMNALEANGALNPILAPAEIAK